MAFIKKKSNKYTKEDMRCSCGGRVTILPDTEAEEAPESFDAIYFSCNTCSNKFWGVPPDFGLEMWDDIEELSAIY